MSKPFGEMGGVGVSGAVLAQLFTSVFCLYPQHDTLFILQFYPLARVFFSFSPTDDGFKRWVGTRIPCVSQAGSAW